MFGLERLGTHMPIPETVKVVSNLRQQTLPVPLGRKTAVPVAAANLFELVVQISQSVLAFSVSVSDLTGGRGHPVPLTPQGHFFALFSTTLRARGTVMGHHSHAT